MPSPCNELHEFRGHQRGVFFIMRSQKKINMRKQLRSCTAPNHWCSSAKDTLRDEKWIQLKMFCDQHREKEGEKKVQFTSCSCCLLPYCKWCNGNASAHSSFSFLGCMRETHTNYDGKGMRQLKIHAASWREVSERGALPDSTMQRTKRNREAERRKIKRMQHVVEWTCVSFFFFFIFKASPSRDLRRCFSCSRQSRRNYSVLNQWMRAVLLRLGNDKATAGERRAITSKSLPFNALRIQMSRRSLTFVWQIISKRCDRARTAIPATLPSSGRKFPRFVDEGSPISPLPCCVTASLWSPTSCISCVMQFF